jgi:hypothetical protein
MTLSRFLLALATLGGLLLVRASRQEPPEPFWTPDGYIVQVDAMIRRGQLGFRAAGEVLDDGRVLAQDSIFPSFSPRDTIAGFYERSMLREDVRRFNADPGAPVLPFLIEDGQLKGVNPYYHRVPMPLHPAPVWAGDVRVRSDDRYAALSEIGGLDIRARLPRHLGERDEADVRLFRRADTVSTVVAALLNDASGEYVSRFSVQGDGPGGLQATLEDVRDDPSPDSILVNGIPSTQPGYLWRLFDGDWVRFVLRSAKPGTPSRERVFTSDLGGRFQLASFARQEGATRSDVHRLYPMESLRPLTQPLAQSMNAALSIPFERGGHAGDLETLAGMEIELGIDRALSDGLTRTVGSFCWERRRRQPRPQSVSMTVLDAFSGEVRALPSCPDTTLVQWYDEPLTQRDRQRLLRNQNLRRHPVGSATKPFWVASVATSFPNLIDLQVRGVVSDTIGSVLGCPLRGGAYANSHAHDGGWEGLETFLQRSCNQYLVEMATVAFTITGASATPRPECATPRTAAEFAACFPPAGPNARLRLCDNVYIGAILDERLRGVGDHCDELPGLHEHFAPQRPFAGLTRANVHGRLMQVVQTGLTPEAGWRAGHYLLDAWDEVLRPLGRFARTDDSVQIRMAFSGVSPERTNLQLNSVDDLRNDWISLLLGGEKSAWSNVAMAEATARLMTGRAVRARFASRVNMRGYAPPDSVAPPLDPSVLHPGIRRRVLHGMELVVEGGTAAALLPQVRQLEGRLRQLSASQGVDVYAFAKTGTPRVVQFVPRAQAQRLRRIQAEGMRWDRTRQRVVLTQSAQRVLSSLPSRPRLEIRNLLNELEADPESFTPGPGAAPRTALYLDGAGILRVADENAPSNREGGMLVFGLLAVPGDIGRAAAAQRQDWFSACPPPDSLARRIREVPPVGLIDSRRAVGITVAVYVDDLPESRNSAGSRVAVELLGRSFPVLEEMVVRDWTRKNGGAIAGSFRPGAR